MKTVLSKSDVAHYWANQVQESGRVSGGNFYFRGPSIFSYGSHFEIARHVVNKKGKKACLFTTRSYSNSTHKHVNAVSHAASHLNKIYVPTNDLSNNEANFKEWTELIETQARKLVSARKPEIYLNQIDYLKNQVNNYCKYFETKPSKLLAKAMLIGSGDDFKQFTAKKVQALKNEAAKNKRKALKAWKVEEGKFRAFEINRIYGRIDTDILRFNTVSQRVQTSQGVEIPVQIAKDFYLYILSIINGVGACVDCDSKILNYDVKSIDKDKIVIGCHTIKIDECNTIAKQLGWIK